ncbi:hypothetical protein E5167_02640 [Pontimicrobium aquaticum]|uniref:Uncharacterized protein n=1 Tax=Pontimicrobium aquaticum TaxID=2565367 RepID=A0A4U0F382_9FLAO|nr:hypothetical protein E5167_02640 [Pontimicrobium aquaticum]
MFPEGQTFLPLEVLESYQVDATKLGDRFKLIKKYGLTQFDSGTYTIPRQKVLIGDYEFFTDSLKVEVNTIEVDTTQQPLYSIKPIIEVDKSPSKWWLYLLIIIFTLAVIAFLLYWFIWREKPLTEEEKVALLPPYERAKLALAQLDESGYLKSEKLKEYYSELTGIIRKYLDEKVYDHALESTTEELITRLHLLKDGNQIDLSKEDIEKINTILRRADLVKFAKSKPDIELAKLDRDTIDMEIDHVKEALPEPTEEELLADLKYQEELEEKKRKRKITITVAASVLILVATYIGFGMHYGFNYIKDTIFGNSSLELLEEKDWVTSEYGAPGVIITTPKVLERKPNELPENLKKQMQVAAFGFGDKNTNFDILVISTKMASTEPPGGHDQENAEQEKNEIDLINVAEGQLKSFEERGVTNIITRSEQFITPNGQEGLKTYGTGDFVTENGDNVKGQYVILGFTTQNLLQQVVLVWEEDDVYADQIMERILNSIELIKLEDDEE